MDNNTVLTCNSSLCRSGDAFKSETVGSKRLEVCSDDESLFNMSTKCFRLAKVGRLVGI